MGSIKGSSGSRTICITVILLAVSTCCIAQLVPSPSDVKVTCPNYNCTLTWNAPENSTSSDDVKYTVEYEIWVGDNATLVEILDCVDITHTECNLVEWVDMDSFGDIHFVTLSAMVNGMFSEPIEGSFIPNFKATLEHPDIVLIEPVQSTEFTVHVFAPLSPYEDPNTGELYRVDELPPFKRNFLKSKFQHSSTLYKVEPRNELEEIQKENGPTLDKVVTFSDLQPYTSYRLEVISYLKRGLGNKQSKQPSIITVTTAEDVPSQGPTLLSIVRKPPICSSSPDTSPVIVTWQPPPPEHCNGQLTHYTLQYMLNGRNFSQALSEVCDVTNNSLILQLNRWQAYEFAVLACNAVGCAESRHKTLFNLQALKKGSQPKNVSIDYKAPNPLLISWLPPNITECIDKYLVTIETDDSRNDAPIKEMVFDATTLQINRTLLPGSYTVLIRSFVRSGVESGIPGEIASKKFMIETKTIVNHIILPIVITCSFIFSAVMVAIVICAKWILRPFDIHLEKTRALKLARQYHIEPTHYHHTEHEVYDPLPSGSRRPSRMSKSSTSSRPSLTINPRELLRSLSSSGNHPVFPQNAVFPQNGEVKSKLTSHSEEPHENDALLPSVLYSPVSNERSREDGEQSSQSSAKQSNMATNFTYASSGSDGSVSRRPMLTIQVQTNHIGPRVVRWTAGGVDAVFDEEDDPFDLPKAEDFDEFNAVFSRGVSDAVSSRGVSQASPSEGPPSAANEPSRSRLNYPSLMSQSSVNSENCYSPPPVDAKVTQANLFESVYEEESDNETNESQRTSYAQLASNSQPLNPSVSNPNSPSNQNNPSVSNPNSPSNQNGSIGPYAQISNSQAARQTSNGIRENQSGRNIPEGYTILAQSDQQVPPRVSPSPGEMRRSISNPSASDMQRSPMQQRRTQSEDGLSEPLRDTSLVGAIGGSNGLASPYLPRAVFAPARNNLSSPYLPFPNPILSVGASPAPVRRDNPALGSPHQVSPDINHSASHMSLDSNRHIQSPVAPLIHDNNRSRTESSQLLPLGHLTPSGSPSIPRRHELSGHGRPQIRLPILHAPGSPLLPSRALDTAPQESDSDSEDSQFINNHSSVSPNRDESDRTSLNYPSLESQTSESSEASSVQPILSASKPNNCEEYVCNGATATATATEPSSSERLDTSYSSQPALRASKPNNCEEYVCNGATAATATHPSSNGSSPAISTSRPNNSEVYVCNGATSALATEPSSATESRSNESSQAIRTSRPNNSEVYVCNGATSPLPTEPSSASEPLLNESSETSSAHPIISTSRPNNSEEYICNGATVSATTVPSPINAAESCKTGQRSSPAVTVPSSPINAAESCKTGQRSSPAVSVENGSPYVEQVNGELVNSCNLHNGNTPVVVDRKDFVSEDEDDYSASEMSITAFVNGSLPLNMD